MGTEHMVILALTGVAAFLITALVGRRMIPALHKLKFGQTIREIGPAWHKNKQGTPTMGGLIFITGWLVALAIAAMVSQFFFSRLPGMEVLAGGREETLRFYGGILLALGCGLIGFVDDYIKVVKKRNLGLTSGQKLIAQLLVGTAYALCLYWAEGGYPKMDIPFVGTWNMGLWVFPICIFIVVGGTNATNLTDGVDGLCGSVSFVAALFFVVASCILGTAYFNQGLIAAALAGGLAGFLLFNLHPAKVFMGDTGSLFIGGVLVAMAFGMGIPLLLVPVGIIYIVETLSVMLQVTYFKLTHGKRIFKMSPLHHHFEMSGWSENKVVGVFTFITLTGCAAATLLLIYA